MYYEGILKRYRLYQKENDLEAKKNSPVNFEYSSQSSTLLPHFSSFFNHKRTLSLEYCSLCFFHLRNAGEFPPFQTLFKTSATERNQIKQDLFK